MGEVQGLLESASPHHVAWIMDANVGQAAGEEAEILVRSVPDSSIIFTKLDLGSLGAGAISAVAARELPISFVACGQSLRDFDRYDAGSLVRYMLLDRDQRGFMERLRGVDLVRTQVRIPRRQVRV